MLFSHLAATFDELEKTPSRLAMTSILSELIKKSDDNEVSQVIYLSLGALAPRFEGVVFNVADQMMLVAVARAFDKDPKSVVALYKQKGDIGSVVFDLNQASKSSPKKYSALDVFGKLQAIAVDEGEKSQDRKIEGISVLLKSLDAVSAKYVVRIVLGKLRLGFSDLTIIDAISYSQAGDKSLSSKIKKAYEVMPDIGKIAHLIKSKGVKSALHNVAPVIGIPVLPMLTQRLKDPKEMIEKMGPVSIEPKLDGLRILIHFDAKKKLIKAFTRNLNENSWMFPELTAIAKHLTVDSAILDTEAVGLDEQTKKMADFQTTMTRRRKHDIVAKAGKTSINFYVFDILAAKGENLMDKTYLERRAHLEKAVKEIGLFKLVERWETSDPADISQKNKELKIRGFEGVVVKRNSGTYVPGRTGWRWVKMKEDFGSLSKLSDTLDCVVMGFTRGRGKRASFGLGQFLVGVRDGEEIKTITKVGTGLTDEQFRSLNAVLEKLKVPVKPKEYSVPKDLEPDVWVIPSLLVEITADAITKSPKHTSGYAMRFPRLVGTRDDKDVSQATTIAEVRRISDMQVQ